MRLRADGPCAGQVFLLSAALAAGSCTRKDDAVFDQLSGTWDWADKPGSCVDNPQTISFSADRRTMTFSHPHPVDGPAARAAVWRYEIRSHGRASIRAAIVDPPETRRTPTGDLVVWDLVLVGPDEFVWHATHWPQHGVTKKIVRCRQT